MSHAWIPKSNTVTNRVRMGDSISYLVFEVLTLRCVETAASNKTSHNDIYQFQICF